MKTIVKIALIAALLAFVGVKLFAGGGWSQPGANKPVRPTMPHVSHRGAAQAQEILQKAVTEENLIDFTNELAQVKENNYALSGSLRLYAILESIIESKMSDRNALQFFSHLHTHLTESDLEKGLELALKLNNQTFIHELIILLEHLRAPRRQNIAERVNAAVPQLPTVLGKLIAAYAI